MNDRQRLWAHRNWLSRNAFTGEVTKCVALRGKREVTGNNRTADAAETSLIDTSVNASTRRKGKILTQTWRNAFFLLSVRYSAVMQA